MLFTAQFATDWFRGADAWLAPILAPLAAWIVLSGLDDAFIVFLWLVGQLRKREPEPSEEDLRARPEGLIAILVPLWHEHRVVRRMVEHNIAAIRYSRYHIFIGVYPNDTETVREAEQIAAKYPSVHVALVPHDGPTSKADCLNVIHAEVTLHEEATGERFAVSITHDAEDLVHPDSLRWINYHARDHGMSQIPVLPLPTPLFHFTHGVYCDEFAENQTKDLQVRRWMGAFLPSSGVGTGFGREALGMIAAGNRGQPFDPGCLTEDYENGFRLHRIGCRQIFLLPRVVDGAPVATREYFPRTFRSAVKQRTRWITGIVFQGWEKHGWEGNRIQKYWHWRDRKGLVGTPLSLAANLLLLYGMAGWIVAFATGGVWFFGRTVAASLYLSAAMPLSLFLTCLQLGARMYCCARYYGWRFAALAPARLPYANLINTLATAQACWRYARSRVTGARLVWLKTEHFYPARQLLIGHRQDLREVLVKNNYIGADALEEAIARKPSGQTLGDFLVNQGLLAEREVYEALSLQQSVPLVLFEPSSVQPAVARALPAHVVEKWNVVPVRIEDGCLYVAGPEPPSEKLQAALRPYTNLEVKFELAPRSNYDQTLQAWIGKPTAWTKPVERRRKTRPAVN